MDIAERPRIVEEKSRVGDWEGDTGARHRGTVLSLVDRTSRFTLLALLGGRTAGETGEAMRKHLGPYKEFAARREVAGARVVLLFAQPYRERGLNEHANGLVHQYRRPIFAAPPNRVENLLNNRPRKASDSRGSFQAGG